MNELGENIKRKLTDHILFDVWCSLGNDFRNKIAVDVKNNLESSIWINLGHSLYEAHSVNSHLGGIEDGLTDENE